jgi:hypothetical protein
MDVFERLNDHMDKGGCNRYPDSTPEQDWLFH